MQAPFHTFEHAGHQFRLYYDTIYATRGSYAYETEEETKAAEDEEIAKLDSGEWVVIGFQEYKPCPCDKACPNCDGWTETDNSCWGIVVEYDIPTMEALVKTEFA